MQTLYSTNRIHTNRISTSRINTTILTLAMLISALLLYPAQTSSQSISPQQQKNIDANYTKAIQEVTTLLLHKDFKTALKQTQAVLVADTIPSLLRSRIIALLAAAYRGIGDEERAMQEYTQASATAQNTTLVDTNVFFLSLHDRLMLEQAIYAGLQGKISITGESIGSSIATIGTQTTNKQDIERLLSIAPMNGLALYQYSYTLFKQQQYDSALVYARRASEYLPPLQSASAYYVVGLSLFFTQRYSDAIQAFSRTVGIAPYHAESYFYRGCAYTKLENYSYVIRDFRSAVQYNPVDAASMGLLGSLLINAGQRTEGCARLLRAADLGYTPAIELIDKYCNNVTEDGAKIVRLPTVTVEADKNINYAQRIKQTKQGINVGKTANPMFRSLRNMGRFSRLAGVTTLDDGTVITQGGSSPIQSGMIPLQSMINPADCNSGVINTQSFISLQCIAYFLRQETEPMGNKEINKLVKQLGRIADELTIMQSMIGGKDANLAAMSGNGASNALASGGDIANMNAIYRDFQAILNQIERKLEEFEKTLKTEGKI